MQYRPLPFPNTMAARRSDYQAVTLNSGFDLDQRKVFISSICILLAELCTPKILLSCLEPRMLHLHRYHGRNGIMSSQELLKDWQATSEGAVEQTKKQGREAMDNYFDFLHKAIGSIPTGGTQLGEKLKSYSEENIAVARDYMRKLSQAKDFTEVVQIQLDFARAQFNAFSGQAKGLSEAYTKTAADAVSKPFKKVA
jgi:hypothetical protein